MLHSYMDAFCHFHHLSIKIPHTLCGLFPIEGVEWLVKADTWNVSKQITIVQMGPAMRAWRAAERVAERGLDTLISVWVVAEKISWMLCFYVKLSSQVYVFLL